MRLLIFLTYHKEKKNEVYNDAYRQVLVMPELFFIRKTYALVDLLKEVETVSYDEVMAFSKDVLSHIYIKATYFGNLTEEKIKRSFNTIIATFEKEYDAKPNADSTIYETEFLNYHAQESFVYNLPRPVNNSANLNVLYYPVKNSQMRAAFRVFSSWLSPEYFAELRTKKQLGYVAAANVRLFNDEIPYFMFLLQSGEYTRAKLNNE